MSAAGPRVATQNPPYAEKCSSQQPVLRQRFARIMRAGGAKPTRGPKKRAQVILVKLDEADNYPQHRCN